MAISTKKKAAVILRDSNGNLFQAMPETRADCVSYGNTTASAEMARQADYDVSGVSTEIETQTEEHTEHIQPNGTISISDDAFGSTRPLSFAISLYNAPNDQYFNILANNSYPLSLLEHFRDENNVLLMNSSDYCNSETLEVHIPANRQYHFDFSLQNLNFVPNAISIALAGCNFVEEGNSSIVENEIVVAGNNYISNSSYTGATINSSSDIPLIQFTLPSIGGSETFCFNAFQHAEIFEHVVVPLTDWEPLEYLDKFITIQNLDGTNYRLIFQWNTARDVEVVETTKLFKTTISRADNTTTVSRTAISGLLQNIDASYSETIETVSNVPVSNKYRYGVAIGDQEGTRRIYI